MKARPAGELPSQKYAIFEGEMPRAHKMGDPPDTTRRKRPCCRCGKRFQPTLKRLMLCLSCFTGSAVGGMDG